MSITPEDRYRVLELAAAGMPQRAIARETGLSTGAVQRAVKAGVRKANTDASPAEREARRKQKQNERAARYRQRQKAAAAAAFREARSADRRSGAAAPSSGAIIGEPLPERKAQIWLHGVERFTDRQGNDLRAFAPRVQPRVRRGDVGLGRVLNDNDARRDARAQALEAGLDAFGMCSVLMLDAAGNPTGRYSFDPLDSADLKRASDLTGLDVSYLSRAAYDPKVVATLKAGSATGAAA